MLSLAQLGLRGNYVRGHLLSGRDSQGVGVASHEHRGALRPLLGEVNLRETYCVDGHKAAELLRFLSFAGALLGQFFNPELSE